MHESVERMCVCECTGVSKCPCFFFPSMSLSSPPPPSSPYRALCISPLSAFLFLSGVFFFFMPQSHLFLQKRFFFFLSVFLFTLYIDEIGFFCSPMEDNHCSNCHLIAKFHRAVKGRNTGEGALKNSNSFYLSISVCASDRLSSSPSVCHFSIALSLLPSVSFSKE